MILVDTSVWIDHLRSGDSELVALLNNSWVLMHPFVLGELACGNLHNRAEVLVLLRDLPQADMAGDEEVLFFIEAVVSVISMLTCWPQQCLLGR